MNAWRIAAAVTLAALTLTSGTAVRAQHALARPIDGRPDAIIDLRTTDGARLAGAQWRYSDVRIVDAQSNAPGPDLRPTGPLMNTYDYTPKANAANFDDSAWEAIDAPALETRRGHGKLSFNWYRTSITVPERVGTLDTTGTTIVFEIVVDDYAEVSVDGQLPRVLGQTGGPLVKGFNAPNRVVLTRNARPGQRIQLAVFGANGPLSDPPSNFIWVRSATLDFYRPAAASHRIVRPHRAPRPGTRCDRPAGRTHREAGRAASSSPKVRYGCRTGICCSAIRTTTRSTAGPRTMAFQCSARRAATRASTSANTGQPGSNGLASIARIGSRSTSTAIVASSASRSTGAITVLADGYQGKRLNSPNDLVYRSDGSLYFTDPPFGLPKTFDDPAQGAAVQRSVPLEGRRAAVADQGVERPQRHRVLTRRTVSLRRRLGREAQGRDAIRRGG